MELCSYGAIVPLCPFEFPKAVRGPSPYLIATMELMNLGLCLSFLSFYPCLYPILRAPLCVDYRPFLCPLGEVRYRAWIPQLTSYSPLGILMASTSFKKEKKLLPLFPSLAFFRVRVLVYPLIDRSSLFEIKLQAIFDGGRTASKRCPGTVNKLMNFTFKRTPCLMVLESVWV